MGYRGRGLERRCESANRTLPDDLVAKRFDAYASARPPESSQRGPPRRHPRPHRGELPVVGFVQGYHAEDELLRGSLIRTYAEHVTVARPAPGPLNRPGVDQWRHPQMLREAVHEQIQHLVPAWAPLGERIGPLPWGRLLRQHREGHGPRRGVVGSDGGDRTDEPLLRRPRTPDLWVMRLATARWTHPMSRSPCRGVPRRPAGCQVPPPPRPHVRT